MKRPLIILTGPTAVGKTDISIKLAKAVNGEIVSADSMQAYRHMDIGSAKVARWEMEGVPHYLIDVAEPTEEFNVVAFQRMAKEALGDIYSHGSLPIVTGGTGFYIQALLYDIDFSQGAEDHALRSQLKSLAGQVGPEGLHRMLAQVDPESARQIHANNQKRVIRAIEYYRLTGEPISEHNRRERRRKSPYQFLYYVLDMDRQSLYQRIDQRVDAMIGAGLVEEVGRLLDMGCHPNLPSMQGLGYKEIAGYLQGKTTLEEAVYMIKRDTRHFAKRQLTWFKRERSVRWLRLEEYGNDREKILEEILKDVKDQLGWEMDPYGNKANV